MTEVTAVASTELNRGHRPSLGEIFKQHLPAAIDKTAPHFVFGLSIGLALVGAASAFGANGYTGVGLTLTEHLGMGFIVAAIAIVFYEWGSHYKEVRQLLNDLYVTSSASDEYILTRALTVNLSRISSDLDPLSSNIGTLIQSLRELQEHGDWAKDAYISYLGRSIERVAGNAKSLCALSTHRDAAVVTPDFPVLVIAPAKLTDFVLAALMGKLGYKGTYSVASNVGSWRNYQLDDLAKMSEHVVLNKSVKIRRIFVLAHEGPHADATSVEEAREILEDHLAIADRLTRAPGEGSYEVKLLDNATKEKIHCAVPQGPNFIFANHFGIFSSPGALQYLRVRVTEPDLSDLRIAGLPNNVAELKRFEAVWDALAPLTPELIAAALPKHA